MKKGLIAIFCLLILTFTSLPVSAQTRYRRYDTVRRYEQRSNDYRYRDGRRNRWDRDRGFWDEHRDKLTTGIGAGAGAAVGAAMGGKKGAILGAIIGGGGAAIRLKFEEQATSPQVSTHRRLQLGRLKPGNYVLDLLVVDATGRRDHRSQEFQVVEEKDGERGK